MLSLRIGKSKLTFRFAIGNHSLVMKKNHIKWDKWLLHVYERTAADAASIIFRRWRVDLVGDVDMIIENGKICMGRSRCPRFY